MGSGKQNALELVDPTKIRLNDDKIENSVFRNARSTLKKEEMASNRESIRKLGLLKPLIVRPISNDPEGYLYQLVCGSRRLRNILRLRQEAIGISREKRPFKPEELCYKPETAEWLPATEVYETVKVFVRDCDDEMAIAINIAENLEHSKLPEIDLMEFCQELVSLKDSNNNPRYSREKIAELCNRSESWVSLTLDLNQLPERVKQMMFDDRVTRTAALAFLQTQREKIDTVIDVAENIVRQGKLAEARAAEEEINFAQIELDDAQNDVEIHDLMGNDSLREMAQRRETAARKRVSSASEKRDTALQEAEAPKLTADVINQANLMVPDAKIGKPKAIPVKEIRSLYAGFKEYKEANEADLVIKTIDAVFQVILGHRAFASIQSLIEEQKNPPDEVNTNHQEEMPHEEGQEETLAEAQ